LIARQHAKSWIIHLQDESTLNAHSVGLAAPSFNGTAQCALKGHIIIFPMNPEALAQFLPPALEEVITPLCIIFVGPSPPSKEWLLKNARPLIVRQEKVQRALEWLIHHNPLYSDIQLDEDHLKQLPKCDIPPVLIHSHCPTAAAMASGSRYDPHTSEDGDCSPTAGPIYQNVVVCDIDMHDANTAEMTAATIRHLKRANGEVGAHIQIKHLPNPANHYSDPHLLALLYPTLFPFGIG
ncbi:uncharacterized protein EI90DRAFT_2833454, partial [Cantharellus anzutake]|uniref:uncharacterized protein n=1 Tax=Cantharellus anzutake TaxID=1750568 RepID=UPI0019034502